MMNNPVQQMVDKFGTNNAVSAHDNVEQPSLSVIIPSFNCLEFLPRAIQSIQLQDIDDLQIIILDDNSSDGTWEYLNLAKQCDQRILAVRLEGVGVAKARNIGIEQAQGQYIAFLDADDYWLPGKLCRQLDFHHQYPNATLSFSNYRHINQNAQDLGDCFSYWPKFAQFSASKSKEQPKQYHLLGREGISRIFAENVIGTSTVVINKANMDDQFYFDHTLGSAEDWDLWLRAAKNGPIGFSNAIDMIYLMRQGSESSKTRLRLHYMKTIMKRHYKAVLAQSPLALVICVSRLLTGYAELYREQLVDKRWLGRKFSSIKSCSCHFLAFLLSPSVRALKATLCDVRQLLLAR